MDGKVFSKETEERIVFLVADAVKGKVPLIVRPLVKPAVGIVVGIVNKQLDKVIPDKIDGLLNEAFKYGDKDQWDLAADKVGEAADMLVDIPLVDDNKEKELFVSIAQVIVNAVKTWIDGRK